MWLTLLIGVLGWIVFSFLYFFFINLFFTEAYSPNPKYNDIDNEFMSIFLIIFSIFWCYFCELPLANSIIYISFFIIAHLLKELQMVTRNKKYAYPIFVGPILFYFYTLTLVLKNWGIELFIANSILAVIAVFFFVKYCKKDFFGE
ncbi:hypothetical protein [Campylobacter ureolyticus]|uniref:hypothetical protein n=1 Tax=Campylobacter ureolyticus TaxID=827 RepID=UPI00288C3622|nr:hypothetical protein [Campylobacter ureolyticus]